MKNSFLTDRLRETKKTVVWKKSEKDKVFNTVYNMYAQAVHAYCRCVVDQQDAAEDIFQETFIKFYSHLDTIDNFDNSIGYLISSARNLSINYKRDKKNNIEVFEECYSESVNEYENTELLELIITSLELLEPKYREVFVLHEFQGMSYKDLSRTMNISADSAKTRYLRGKQMLIKLLKPYINDLNK